MKHEQFDLIVTRMLARRPFRPIVLELSSGSRITVYHPEAIARSAGMVSVLDRRGGPHYFEEDDVVHVTRGANGRHPSGASRR
jgi:hypothetical protein